RTPATPGRTYRPPGPTLDAGGSGSSSASASTESSPRRCGRAPSRCCTPPRIPVRCRAATTGHVTCSPAPSLPPRSRGARVASTCRLRGGRSPRASRARACRSDNGRMAEPEKIVLVDGARTPVGSFGGVFKNVPAHEFGATAVREALARSGVRGDDVDEVVMGCIGQVGPDAYNARRVAVSAGLPTRVPAYTVNRLCGSGLQAIWSAAMQMRWGAADIAVAGGDESMTRMPFYDFGARSGYRLGNRELADGTLLMLTDPFHDIHMG